MHHNHDGDGDSAHLVIGHARCIEREQQLVACLMDMTKGPHPCHQGLEQRVRTLTEMGVPSAVIGRGLECVGGSASAESYGAVATSRSSVCGGDSGVLARGGASKEQAVESAKEKMLPYNNSANMYAQPPRVVRLEGSTYDTAAGLLVAAPGKGVSSRKGKAMHVTRIPRSDRAEVIVAQSKPAFRVPLIETPFEVRNDTRSISVQLTQLLEAERNTIIARRGLEVQTHAQRIMPIGSGGGQWRGDLPRVKTQPHDRQLHTNLSYSAPEHGRIVGIVPHPLRQVPACGLATELTQSFVGEIVSKFYKHMPPAIAGGMNDPRQAIVGETALRSFKAQSQGWDPFAFHQVAAPINSPYTPQHVARLVRTNQECNGSGSGGGGDSGGGGGGGSCGGGDGDGGGGGGHGGGGGSYALDQVQYEGNDVDSMSMQHWDTNLSHRQAGNNIHGHFVVKETTLNQEVNESMLQDNEIRVSELIKTMERVRRVVSNMTDRVPTEVRFSLISRVEPLLTEIFQRAPLRASCERTSLGRDVKEVQSWMQQQLRERYHG